MQNNPTFLSTIPSSTEPKTTMHIRPATIKDIPRIAQIGATAFAQEPIYARFFPWRAQYPLDFLRFFQEDITKMLMAPGEVVMVAETDESDGNLEGSEANLIGGSKVVAYATFVRHGNAQELAQWKPDTLYKSTLPCLLQSIYTGSPVSKLTLILFSFPQNSNVLLSRFVVFGTTSSVLIEQSMFLPFRSTTDKPVSCTPSPHKAIQVSLNFEPWLWMRYISVEVMARSWLSGVDYGLGKMIYRFLEMPRQRDFRCIYVMAVRILDALCY